MTFFLKKFFSGLDYLLSCRRQLLTIENLRKHQQYAHLILECLSAFLLTYFKVFSYRNVRAQIISRSLANAIYRDFYFRCRNEQKAIMNNSPSHYAHLMCLLRPDRIPHAIRAQNRVEQHVLSAKTRKPSNFKGLIDFPHV